MPRLGISLFGPLVVTLDGTVASGFTSKKAQALLAYLAVEADRPHSREELAGLLWPDYAEASARANLRSVLANVRRVLDDRNAALPFLLIAGETVQYNCAADQQVDVAVFERQAPVTLGGQVVTALEAAVAQVRAPFLAGFSLPDSPPFEEWMLLKREYLGRQVAAARQQLAGHWLAQGALDAGAGACGTLGRAGALAGGGPSAGHAHPGAERPAQRRAQVFRDLPAHSLHRAGAGTRRRDNCTGRAHSSWCGGRPRPGSTPAAACPAP